MTHEGELLVLLGPHDERLVESVELRATVALAAPHALDALAELGVPQERWQVVQRDHHRHVVHRSMASTTRIARSAADFPRKSQTSPVHAVASTSVVVVTGTIVGSVRSREIEDIGNGLVSGQSLRSQPVPRSQRNGAADVGATTTPRRSTRLHERFTALPTDVDIPEVHLNAS